MRLLYWQAPTILNPHLATGFKDFDAARIVYEPLASKDENGEFVLFLAAEAPSRENGGVAEDGRSVTWKLKEDVTWADGEPFTAEDVVFTYEYLSNPDVAAASTANYETVESVEAIDDYTVQVNFKDVTPGWEVPFTGQNGMILPEHIFAEFNGANAREAPANQMPVGTGPYQVVEFKPGDLVVLEANADYWDGAPPFNRVEVKGGGDATSAARAVLQTGDADYAYNLQVEANILEELEAAGQGRVSAVFGPYVERIMFNFTDPNAETADGERSSLENPHPFFTDKRVRQAFTLAIDRDAIAEQLYGPTGRATGQLLVSPGAIASDNISYEYNLEQAEALLDEAGWEDTNDDGVRDQDGVEMNVVFQTSVNPVRQKTQEIVKQSLESIGVGVELKSIDAGIFFSGDPANTDTINHFYADMQEYNTGNDSPDPGPYMKWWTCDQIAQMENDWQLENNARYCNPEYDALWEASATELDPETRNDLFKQMDEFLMEDVAVMPIVDRANTNGVSNRLEGVEPSPWDANTWDIKNWRRAAE
ncbi:MAG: peptide ABC transporter substrate-binding protein [Spirulinaceae cyanobacterium SM2_1_0]|nr:peptide ABC transporter substrate-binding protein [Spirulinaceae cyanobacterium SM2_1_0]